VLAANCACTGCPQFYSTRLHSNHWSFDCPKSPQVNKDKKSENLIQEKVRPCLSVEIFFFEPKEVQMQKKASLLIGVTLILLGVLALAGNLLIRTGGGILAGFSAWPLFVVAAGLLFCIPPFLFSRQRGLSGLFVPGIPTLTTGILLFIASVSGNWSIWATLWPLEVLSVAAAFILMAIFLKVPWLMIPASILGFTGLILQFCALTGLWGSWVVLWTLEPFAVGLPLLLIGMAKKIEGVKLAGIILCGLAGLAFAAMSSLLVTKLWITRLVGPVIVLGLGILLIVSALGKKSAEMSGSPLPVEEQPEKQVEEASSSTNS
jgi:hypothetical protein